MDVSFITSDRFLHSGIWKEKRKKILRRDGYLCRECKKYGRNSDAVYVHHIKSRKKYPELALVDSNLESVCLGCHNKFHPEKGGARQPPHPR